jgi:hypothetical protein
MHIVKSIGGTIKHPIGAITHPLRTTKRSIKETGADVKGALGMKSPEVPGVPTIDTARQRQDLTDQFTRRKGKLATIFGGGSAAAPSVGRTMLGGY